jgi:uncharacterized protein (TIGR00297 family)
MDDVRLKAYVDACFVEYKSLRDEILSTITEIFRLLQFGTTALLGLLGVAFNFWGKQDFLVRALLGILIPSLGFICVEIQIGQMARIRRASKFCQLLEEKLRLVIGDVSSLGFNIPSPGPLSWESWVEGPSVDEDRHLTWIYAFAVHVFVWISVVSVFLYEFYSVHITKCSDLMGCVFPDTTTSLSLSGPAWLEALKIAIAWKQAKEMARPSNVPLFPPIRSEAFIMIRNRVMYLYRAGTRTVASSGIIAALLHVVVVYVALGTPGAIVILTVIFGGTFVSSLPRLVPKRAVARDLQEPRTWRNAVANGGVAAAISLWHLLPVHPPNAATSASLVVGSLAAALSDTVSHELGVLIGGRPRLITTFRRARIGEDGAVSLWGTLLGLVTACGLSGLAFTLGLLDARSAVASAIGGFIGNLVDSVLGATLERKGVLGNNGVNVCCTITGAIASFLAKRVLG